MNTEPQSNQFQSGTEQPSKPSYGASGVTGENYHAKAHAFCEMRARFKEDWGVTINPIDHPQAWGAWSAYFKAKRIPGAFFNQRGQQAAQLSNPDQRAEKGYQVPAMLPSDFDADYDWLHDKHAGDRFMAAQERARAAARQTPEGRDLMDRINRAVAGLKKTVARHQAQEESR